MADLSLPSGASAGGSALASSLRGNHQTRFFDRRVAFDDQRHDGEFFGGRIPVIKVAVAACSPGASLRSA